MKRGLIVFILFNFCGFFISNLQAQLQHISVSDEDVHVVVNAAVAEVIDAMPQEVVEALAAELETDGQADSDEGDDAERQNCLNNLLDLISKRTRSQALAKTLSYRGIGTLATTIITYIFASVSRGAWNIAVASGITDAVAKFILYYLHERCWNGMGRMRRQTAGVSEENVQKLAIENDSRLRSFLKAISYRILGTLTTIAVVFICVNLFTTPGTVAVVSGGIDLVAKLILYYLHEQCWKRIRCEQDDGGKDAHEGGSDAVVDIV